MTLPAMFVSIKYKLGLKIENSMIAALNKHKSFLSGGLCFLFQSRLDIFLNIAFPLMQKVFLSYKINK